MSSAVFFPGRAASWRPLPIQSPAWLITAPARCAKPSPARWRGIVLAPPGITAPFIAENGQFQFRLTGTVGGSYVVLASTNLTAWTPIATNVVPAAAFNYVTDPFATNYTQRFYRAVSE